MFTPFCSSDLSTISIKDKKALLSQLKAAIKQDAELIKKNAIIIKSIKENEKKAKVLEQIKSAELKLAKLTAKLAG